MIVSRAHEWVGLLPTEAGLVKCIRCGAKTRVGEWDIPRRTPHFESETSGYRHEPDEATA